MRASHLLPVLLILAAPAAHAQTSLLDRLFKRDTPTDTAPAAPRAERIMQDFVPDPSGLEPLTGAQMRERYPGRTVKGIYLDRFLSEQRFVEAFTDRNTTYSEGEIEGVRGDWSVAGDIICFHYAEIGDTRHCFREYTYGDCVVVYPANMPRDEEGLPRFPGGWNSINQFVEDDFAWPPGPARVEDSLTCRLLVS